MVLFLNLLGIVTTASIVFLEMVMAVAGFCFIFSRTTLLLGWRMWTSTSFKVNSKLGLMIPLMRTLCVPVS